MTIATIRGVAINYEIIGDRGPAMAITPGGRNGMDNTCGRWQTGWRRRAIAC